MRAQDLDNYRLVALDCVRRTIRIKSAVYDATTETVTLSPAHRLNFHHRFRLTVIGTGPSGITDMFGNLLDGQNTGHPGSNFVTILTARDLVLSPIDPGIHGQHTEAGASADEQHSRADCPQVNGDRAAGECTGSWPSTLTSARSPLISSHESVPVRESCFANHSWKVGKLP